ncbi:uncharacterized protein [Dysidea avara]|uniref:uncharacterized protein n=1 Tax=Dysidea avara TaxID=196820 RepID=UPI0033239F2E
MEFADDAALYATSDENFVSVARSFVEIAGYWGLTVSLMKTTGVKIGDTPSSFVNGVPVADQSVEIVKEFPYLGSVITDDGEVTSDVRTRITKAASMFGCLKDSVFVNPHLSVTVKKAVYKAVVLATLLYGSECWAVKATAVHHLETFHHHCVRCIMGVTCHQQWCECITTEQLLSEFGMAESLKCLLMERPMKWPGHVCRMDDSHHPKQLLFGELVKPQPFHGPKQRWRDVIAADLKTLDVPLRMCMT